MPETPVSWAAIAPFAVVVAGATALLVVEVALHTRQRVLGRPMTEAWRVTILAGLTLVTLAVALLLVWDQWRGGGYPAFVPLEPMLRVDRLATFGGCLVLASALLSCILAAGRRAERSGGAGAHYALLLLSVSGLLLVLAATHAVSLYIGLELACLPLYVLVGMERDRVSGLEGALKAFVTGAMASGVLLYGFVLLFGATGQLNYPALRDALVSHNGTTAIVGMGLVLVGLVAKVGLAPFHAPSIDAAHGAPPAIVAQLSVSLRAAALIALLRLLTEGFGVTSGATDLPRAVWTLAALSMIVGSTMACLQSSLKRTLAYVGLAHLGLMSIGLVTVTRDGFAALLFFLLCFAPINLGVLGVLASLTRRERDELHVDDLRGLAYRQPVLAGFMTLFLMALAGFPGTAGFVARLHIFSAAIDAGVVVLTLIALFSGLVLALTAVHMVALMYTREEPAAPLPSRIVSSGEGWVLAVCAFSVLVLGLFPNAGETSFLAWLRALDWSHASVAFLF